MITSGLVPNNATITFLKLKVFPKVKFYKHLEQVKQGISTTSSKSSNSLFMKLEDINGEYKIVENELWLRSKTQV